MACFRQDGLHDTAAEPKDKNTELCITFYFRFRLFQWLLVCRRLLYATHAAQFTAYFGLGADRLTLDFVIFAFGNSQELL